MNWAAIFAALSDAVGVLTGPVAVQAEQLIGAFETALPAIEKGIASAEPFVLNGIKLLGSGGDAIPGSEWDAQLALMQAQVDAVDAQVAADEAAQPGV